MNEQQIRQYIQRILTEAEEEEPKKKKVVKIKPGEIGLSVGGGGFTKVVADAGALAKSNPKQLMANLEIKGGGRDFEGAQKILKQALAGNAVMQQAYGGLTKVSKGGSSGIRITMGQLNARNGAKFLHHTLMGAMKAGLLSSNVPLQIQVDGENVIVYAAEVKGSW
jgi:hypothetical protein